MRRLIFATSKLVIHLFIGNQAVPNPVLQLNLNWTLDLSCTDVQITTEIELLLELLHHLLLQGLHLRLLVNFLEVLKSSVIHRLRIHCHLSHFFSLCWKSLFIKSWNRWLSGATSFMTSGIVNYLKRTRIGLDLHWIKL